MSNIQINLEVNDAPFAAEMLVDRIRQQYFKGDAYGQTIANRLVLSSATQVLCLSIDDSLTNRQLKSLGDEFKRRQPRIARLGDPIMAIHYIEAGSGWPYDAYNEPVSILNCLPVEQWTMMASKPPLITHHPLINQPAGSVAFEGNMSLGMPVTISYDSIAAVDQTQRQVIVSLHIEGNGELLGYAIVRLKNTAAAIGLADALRLRRVKRVSHNELVEAILLYPKPERCRGVERRDNPTWVSSRSHQELVSIACQAHPDDIRNILKKHGAF